MRFIERWKTWRFIVHGDRLMRRCIRYCNEAEKHSMKYPGCKKFRGVSMMDETKSILVDIKKVDGEEK